MKKYTKSHEWIEIEGRYCIVGITHYAQKELGEIVYAQLPKVGQTIHVGEEASVLESTKAAADVYSPASGKVIAINEVVADRPQSINDAPETTAWLFRLELSDPIETTTLLSKAEYEKLVQ